MEHEQDYDIGLFPWLVQWALRTRFNDNTIDFWNLIKDDMLKQKLYSLIFKTINKYKIVQLN